MNHLQLTRRGFAQLSAAGTAALAASGTLGSSAFAQSFVPAPRDVLVYVFLRGGLDGLTLCVPYADPNLYAARPSLAVPRPGAPQGAIDLDGFFGLAPAAAPLLPAFQSGQLAFVHASGSIDPTRSHFEGQASMELGIPGLPMSTASNGWLARHLAGIPPSQAGSLRAVSLGHLTPATLRGAPSSLPIPDLASFQFPGDPLTASARRSALADLYAPAGAPLGTAALESLGTIDLLAQIDFANYVPANGAVYPTGTFGESMRQAAALIKHHRALEAVMIDLEGFDTHAGQGSLQGTLAGLLDLVARSFAAFQMDTLSEQHRITLVAMSEFGRRVAENGSAGTDHGHGGCMMLLGGHVAGGRVITQWPGLAPHQLDQGDVAVTIDYRDVIGEVLAKRMGNPSLAGVFPGHTASFQGVIL